MSGEIWRWGGAIPGGITSVGYTATQFGSHTDIVAISGFERHGLYIRSDGTLWGFGENTNGQVGDGSTTSRATPVQIGSATTWQSVSAGKGFSSAAIQSDGTLWVWGSNTGGMLGIGDTGVTQKESPFQVGSGTTWSKVSVGKDHMLALKTDGTLWAWGWNYSGQLGLGDTTSRASPVQVGTDTDWLDADAGYDHSVGRRSGGTLWAWGENLRGQVGDNSTTDRTSPFQVAGTTWDVVSAGRYVTVATKTDGTVWVWGGRGDLYGQLGDGGVTTQSNVPMQVGAATDWMGVNSGFKTVAAKKTNGDVYMWGANYDLQTYSSGDIVAPTLSLKSTADVTVLFSDATMSVELYVPPAVVDVAESVGSSDSTSLAVTVAPFSAADSFVAVDALWDQNEFLTDAPAITDATETDWYHAMSDAPTAADEFAQSTTRTRTLDDSANATDGTAQQFDVVLADAADAADALSDHIEAAPLSDSATASDAIECNTTSVSTLADGVSTTDLASAVTVDLVAESVSATDATVSDAAVLVADAAAASDALSDSVDSDDSALADVVTAVDECQIQVVSNMVASDTVAAAETLSHKQPGLIAWVMNTETGAPSWHSNYGFLDLAQSGGVTYAVGPDGFSILGADTDNGDAIDAGITYGFSEFGGYDSQGNPKPDERKKRVDAFWFGYTSTDVLDVSVETYGQGLPSYTYTMPARRAEQPINNRVQPGKGLHARYWRIGIDNVGGCDFEVKSLSADVLPGTRRV